MHRVYYRGDSHSFPTILLLRTNTTTQGLLSNQSDCRMNAK